MMMASRMQIWGDAKFLGATRQELALAAQVYIQLELENVNLDCNVKHASRCIYFGKV